MNRRQFTASTIAALSLQTAIQAAPDTEKPEPIVMPPTLFTTGYLMGTWLQTLAEIRVFLDGFFTPARIGRVRLEKIAASHLRLPAPKHTMGEAHHAYGEIIAQLHVVQENFPHHCEAGLCLCRKIAPIAVPKITTIGFLDNTIIEKGLIDCNKPFEVRKLCPQCGNPQLHFHHFRSPWMCIPNHNNPYNVITDGHVSCVKCQAYVPIENLLPPGAHS